MLVRVEAPHFVAGITINETGHLYGGCADPKVVHWQKKTDFLRDYFKSKNWKATVVPTKGDKESGVRRCQQQTTS